ncbi:glycosyltransferase, group 2 family protein [Lentilactobacillus buchneri ATCC 11577]|nr:glycosyltransferase, group 2 family protein [Lentilactobacillus buchneri ATCC 11577]
MKFSVIVPVYNIENYLSMCIDSVLKQQFYDYELILVDDGSTDHSGDICDRYSKSHEQIRVIHKGNEGPSAARNIGIDMANGEYIIFLDGDDMLREDTLSNVFLLINNSKFDIIIGNRTNWSINCEYISYDINDIQGHSPSSIEELCEHIAQKKLQLPWDVYQTIYNRLFLLRSHVKFNIENSGAEDAEFFFRIIPKVRSFRITSLSFVNYRLGREGSLDNTKTYKTVMSQLLTFRDAYNDAVNFKNMKLMKTYFANCYTNIASQVSLIKNYNDKLSCIEFIRSNENIIKFSKGSKYLLAKIIWKFWGYDLGSKIIWKLRSCLKSLK